MARSATRNRYTTSKGTGEVQSQTRLVRRGAVYYFRARIPTDLQSHYARKREVVESLKTKDKREAERLVRLKSVELNARFDAIRRNRSTLPMTTMSDAEIEHIVAKATASRLGADEASRAAGLS